MKSIMSVVIALSILCGTAATAQELSPIALPAPALENDKPFMQAVKERKSSREFADKDLSLQDLANVLWCAIGVNRPESGKRTSPSAMNRQDIDVYAVLKDGVYLYDAVNHELLPVAAGDFRKDAGTQEFVGTTPLNLIYISDLAKFETIKDEENRIIWAAVDAGHCSQNVYLYAAAAGLAVVVRGSVDKVKLSEVLKLRPEQKVLLAQTVGYPK